MGILSTPVDELPDDEQVLATFLIHRLQQVNGVFEMLHDQVEQIKTNSEQLAQRRDEVEQIAAEGEEISESEKDDIVADAEQLGQQGLMAQLVAEQAETLYNAYVDAASQVENDDTEVSEIAEPLLDMDEAVFWLDEEDEYHEKLAELVR